MAAALGALLLSACSGGPPGPSKAVATLEASATPSSTPTEPLPDCEEGCPGPIPAGAFKSKTFLRGLGLTFPDGRWFGTSDNGRELQFDRLGSHGSVLWIWRNPHAVTKQESVIGSVATTETALSRWIAHNRDLAVSKPSKQVIGGTISATTLTLHVADSSRNVDPGCPVKSCVSFLQVAPGDVYAIGYGEQVRLFLFEVEAGGRSDTYVISLDAPDEAGLSALQLEAKPILKSLRFP
jgi:hypothetical protein